MTNKPILCLDFDGVIHSYTSGWQGADVVSDPPVPGAMEFIFNCIDEFQVAVFSSRSHQAGGIDAMKHYLAKNFHEYFEELDYSEAHAADLTSLTMLKIEWPLVKPSAMITLDDRAITFVGIFPTIEQLLSFKPWNKQ